MTLSLSLSASDSPNLSHLTSWHFFLELSAASVWLPSGVLRSYNVSLQCHCFSSDPLVHGVTVLPSHFRLFLLPPLSGTVYRSPFLSLVNWHLALRRQHVIGCLTRLTLAAHILPHGTIKGKTDFRLRPKFIDWNNCIPKTLRHFSPWRFSNPQW